MVAGVSWPALARLDAGRTRLPFRAVNRRDRPGHLPGMQRHHLIPSQLLAARWLGPLIEAVDPRRAGLDDFRCNGLLLPCSEPTALQIGLPLHRGPHRYYSQLVAERLGRIETDWAHLRLRAPEIARERALMRLALLQRALRRRLLATARPLRLSRCDPLGMGRDFAELDSLVEQLWGATAIPA